MRKAIWPFVIVACGALMGCRSRDAAREPAWARLPAGAQAGDPTVSGDPARLPRLAGAPVIDGRLDEPAWSAAAALGPFVDVGDGHAAREDDPVWAFARAGWDDGHLYLGFVVRDGAPATPFARDADDPHVWGASSAVEIMLQPGDPADRADNRDYYEIQIDTAGAVFDSHFDDYNAPITVSGSGPGAQKRFGHQEWSSRVERASLVVPGRLYTVEAAIPFAALVPSARAAIPPRPGDVWRLELYSFRDGQRRALGWSPIRRQGNFHKASRFGRVKFE